MVKGNDSNGYDVTAEFATMAESLRRPRRRFFCANEGAERVFVLNHEDEKTGFESWVCTTPDCGYCRSFRCK